jgi:hypothetical protein
VRCLDAPASGFHEAETFSAKNWWKREPDDVLGVVKRRHQECR